MACSSILSKINSSMTQETKEKLVVATKLFVVAAVIAGLITASIFTGGLAAAAFAAGTSATASFALAGASAGFAVTVIVAPIVAYEMKMHKYDKEHKNLEQTALYVGAMALGMIYIVGRLTWETGIIGCVIDVLKR